MPDDTSVTIRLPSPDAVEKLLAVLEATLRQLEASQREFNTRRAELERLRERVDRLESLTQEQRQVGKVQFAQITDDLSRLRRADAHHDVVLGQQKEQLQHLDENLKAQKELLAKVALNGGEKPGLPFSDEDIPF